jgi:hypothetical protein
MKRISILLSMVAILVAGGVLFSQEDSGDMKSLLDTGALGTFEAIYNEKTETLTIKLISVLKVNYDPQKMALRVVASEYSNESSSYLLKKISFKNSDKVVIALPKEIHDKYDWLTIEIDSGELGKNFNSTFGPMPNNNAVKERERIKKEREEMTEEQRRQLEEEEEMAGAIMNGDYSE